MEKSITNEALFSKLAAAGFESELLPIIPAGATLSASSKIKPEQLGKIPGLCRGSNGSTNWVGFHKFTEHMTTAEEVASYDTWGCPVGIQTRFIPVIDIDIEDEAIRDDVWELLLQVLPQSPVVRTRSNSNRIAIPYRLAAGCVPTGKMSVKFGETDDGKFIGVEFLGRGNQFVAEGMHPSGVSYEWPSGHLYDVRQAGLCEVTPDQLRGLHGALCDLAKSKYGIENDRSRERTSAPSEPIGADRAEVEEALKHIDPDESYPDWISTIMALHSTGEEWAFEVADEWSSGGVKYHDKDVNSRWNNFSNRAGGVTIMTLFKKARQGGWQSVDAKKVFDVIEIPTSTIPGASSDAAETITVKDPFIYLSEGNKVADLCLPPNNAVYKLEEWRNTYANLPMEGKLKWTTAWLQSPDRPTARGERYQPGAARVYEQEGLLWFNPFHMPAYPETTDENRLSVFLEHLQFLFPDAEQREFFTGWLAWTVCRPDIRAKVVPLLVAAEHGMGRGWLVQLIEKLVGNWNCTATKIESMVKENSYQDYLHKSILCVVHEVRVGKNRYEVDAQLRDQLIDERLELNLKYGKNGTFNVYANFLLMSNHRDAMAFDAKDRRLYVLESNNRPGDKAYYDVLYQCLDEDLTMGQVYWYLRRWIDHHAGFPIKGRAPMTEAKRAMIENTRSETGIELEGLLADPPARVMTHAHIKAWIQRDRVAGPPEPGPGGASLTLSDKEIQGALKAHCRTALGGRKLKWHGLPTRIWILSPNVPDNWYEDNALAKDEVRRELKNYEWVYEG